jgi:hypothetical protein
LPGVAGRPPPSSIQFFPRPFQLTAHTQKAGGPDDRLHIRKNELKKEEEEKEKQPWIHRHKRIRQYRKEKKRKKGTDEMEENAEQSRRKKNKIFNKAAPSALFFFSPSSCRCYIERKERGKKNLFGRIRVWLGSCPRRYILHQSRAANKESKRKIETEKKRNPYARLKTDRRI